ncbi:hypothetical protein [Flavobacterium capsici]|uniref:Uncharacterized protein n=1 Tax=Flavobacterium capsici TaxID=3075618 RepID=A0AA96J5R3_9FLAO|nr:MULTISPECIES: hypothetical protein [unclassified Flavobacterium]WNM19276.1 hypothetical protein RN608_01005 [Flavobacterium sp. PMR2A8]WNM20665.1 hypothetical protein RN605_08175 [Flavobacterium sp. PMTSA4]
MSNISKAIQFLKLSPETRFLSIVDQSTSNHVVKKYIYLQEIPNEDLENFLKSNLNNPNDFARFWVEVREKQGNTSVKKASFPVEVNANNNNAPVQTMEVATTQQVQAAPVYNLPASLGGLGVDMLGQIITDKVNSQRYEDKVDQLNEAKDEIRNLRSANDRLDLELRTTKTKLETAEAKETLAVMMAKMENKGFFDGDGFQKLLEKAPEMLEKIAAMKNGGFSPEVEQLGNPNWSETKKEFVTILDILNDQQVQLLGAICHKFSSNPALVQEVEKLIVNG